MFCFVCFSTYLCNCLIFLFFFPQLSLIIVRIPVKTSYTINGWTHSKIQINGTCKKNIFNFNLKLWRVIVWIWRFELWIIIILLIEILWWNIIKLGVVLVVKKMLVKGIVLRLIQTRSVGFSTGMTTLLTPPPAYILFHDIISSRHV